MPLGYADKDPLALVQTRDPRPVERGDVYEDLLPAAVPNNETEPLATLYHFTVPISWTLASKAVGLMAILNSFGAPWAGLRCCYLRL